MKKLLALFLILVICLSALSCKKDTVTYDEDGNAIDKNTGEILLLDESLKNLTYADDADRVFYEIFVGSFSDSDGDGTGDLRGIINRLDYLNDGDPDSGKSLGIEGIWLSPIFKSPSYHKYDVINYETIDPKFGTMDDLQELITACHDRGIKLILDLVINHTSRDNLWFTKFCNARRSGDKSDPYYDFYSTADENSKGRTFGSITGTADRYECNFSSDMPELNYDNEAVRTEMLRIADYYLDMGIDGFRFDAAKYIYLGNEPKNVEFWNWYLGELRIEHPDLYTVAEVWDSDAITLQYAEATSCFDFAISQAEGLISSTAKKGNVNIYTAYVDKYLDSIAAKNKNTVFVPFVSNHDTDRSAGYNTLASGYAQVAANIYILGPGSPFIYYGEEIGMKGSRGGAMTDANRRLAMLWGDDDTVDDPVGTTYEKEKQTNGTVSSQITDPSSLYNYYKKLIQIRRANPEIARGDYTALYFEGIKLGGFISEYEGKRVVVIHNTSGSDVTYDIGPAVQGEGLYIKNVIGLGESSLEGTVLTVGAQTSVVLRFEEK
ncbi:MAG: hypothetical protein IJU57_02480 [Clostridia bacterium]|nr:hypothetical protein [Clostridia bacterium]